MNDIFGPDTKVGDMGVDSLPWRRAKALLEPARGSQHLWVYTLRCAALEVFFRPLEADDFLRFAPTADWWKTLAPEERLEVLRYVNGEAPQP